MEIDNPSEALYFYCGRYLSCLENELNQKIPDRELMLSCIWKVLYVTEKILNRFSPLSLHHDDCCCLDFIRTHLRDILRLEKTSRLIIAKGVIVDETSNCWMTQMRDRYSLLRSLVNRFGIGGLYQ